MTHTEIFRLISVQASSSLLVTNIRFCSWILRFNIDDSYYMSHIIWLILYMSHIKWRHNIFRLRWCFSLFWRIWSSWWRDSNDVSHNYKIWLMAMTHNSVRQYQINRYQKIKYLETDSNQTESSHVIQPAHAKGVNDNPPSYNNLQDGAVFTTG